MSDPFEPPICECFPNEQLVGAHVEPWFADRVIFLVIREMPTGWNKDDKAHFLSMVRFFMEDDPYLFRYCTDQIIRRCLPDDQIQNILSICHDQCHEGYFYGKKTTMKVLQNGFY